MTEPYQVTPEQLTGALVRQLREHYRLSRQELVERAGFAGQARLLNIETKDSWKSGNRETLARVFNDLAVNPPKGKLGRKRGETGDERAERLMSALQANGKALPEAAARFHDELDELEPSSIVAVDESGPVTHSSQIVQRIITPPPPPPLPPSLNGSMAVPTSSFSTAVEPYATVHREPETYDDVLVEFGDGEPLAAGWALESPLTNSEVGTWQRCRRKWWLTYYRRLALIGTDYFGPRAIGNRVHRALAAWYVPDGQERTDPREALERAIVEDWTAITHQHEFEPERLAELNIKFQEAVVLERAIVEGYMQWLDDTGSDANLTVIAPETVLSAHLSGTVAGESVDADVIAKLDVRVQRNSDGGRQFIDHKTVGDFTTPRKTLHMDPQMLEYHLLEWLNSKDGDSFCDAALYNMLRKVKRTGSAKPPFYERVEVHHNPIELDNYRKRLLGVARDVARVRRELDNGADHFSVVYPNPTKDCSWDCDFFAVCSMFDDGSHAEALLEAMYHQVDPNARYDEEKETTE